MDKINIPINGLEQDEIAENLIEFLKAKSEERNEFEYSDFNFEASGIRTLIEILAANTHLIGYYVKMLLNESFIDSANLRSSLLSKAKLNGYLPRSARSSRTNIRLKINLPLELDPQQQYITIEKGNFFTGQNSSSDTRKYYILEDVHVFSSSRREYDEEDNGAVTKMVEYVSPEFTVYEGNFMYYRFRKNNEIVNERFIIPDKNIDIETIRVIVKEEVESTEITTYLYEDRFDTVNADRPIFFLSTAANGFFEIFFGKNKIGKAPPNNYVIEISYISTNGEKGNGCKKLTFIDGTASGRTYTVQTPMVPTSGGAPEESIEELRYNIPNHFKRQGRIVTTDDYKSFILHEFRNVESVNVWGGENNPLKDYNAVYISIKPYKSLYISGSVRKEITEKIKKYQVDGKRIKIIDPEYLKVQSTIYLSIATDKVNMTNSELITKATTLATTYTENNLNSFNNDFSDLALLTYIKSNMPFVKSVFTLNKFSVDYKFVNKLGSRHVVSFGNILVPERLYSSPFIYDSNYHYFQEIDGVLYLQKMGKSLKNDAVLKVGKVNPAEGTATFLIDFDFFVPNTDANKSQITFYSEPKYDDIYCRNNKIIIVDKIQVVLK
jgi:ribosomal protein L20A (L18A)